MSAIGPGDFVEALRDEPTWGIVRGAVYCIAGMADPQDLTACLDCEVPPEKAPGFHLTTDSARARSSGAWCPCGFRPVYRPKPDAFAHLLKEPAHA